MLKRFIISKYLCWSRKLCMLFMRAYKYNLEISASRKKIFLFYIKVGLALTYLKYSFKQAFLFSAGVRLKQYFVKFGGNVESFLLHFLFVYRLVKTRFVDESFERVALYYLKNFVLFRRSKKFFIKHRRFLFSASLFSRLRRLFLVRKSFRSSKLFVANRLYTASKLSNKLFVSTSRQRINLFILNLFFRAQFNIYVFNVFNYVVYNDTFSSSSFL